MAFCLVEFRDSSLAVVSTDAVETLEAAPHAEDMDCLVDWSKGRGKVRDVTKHAATIVKIGGLSDNFVMQASAVL